jgi:holo-[acyl-carrier protein] synthase
MYEIATGVDIEKVSRFEGKSRAVNSRFLNRIFTIKEQEYCFTYKSPGQHLAVRYAGKEAVIKALTELDRAEAVFYKDIEILNNSKNVPVAAILKKGFEDLKINLSFSHTEDTAIAFCIISPVKNV